MMDQRGRVWMTAAVRPPAEPRLLQAANRTIRSPRYFPLERSSRQAAVYDPQDRHRCTPVDTCFSTHHLQFAEDKDHTLYFSGDVERDRLDQHARSTQTRDAAKSQGWCPMIVDTNGDGTIGRLHRSRTQPRDPTKDMRIAGFAYGIIVNPVDGSVWWAHRRACPAASAVSSSATIRRRPARPRSTSRRSTRRQPDGIAGLRAARHRHRSQRRHLDRRCRAVRTWPASTAASARCSTARPRPASTARRAGRSIRRRARR